MMTAVFASKAWIPRKSSLSAAATVITDHFFPPFTVRTTVPSLPLAQITLSFTTLSPRKLAVVGRFKRVHCWAEAVAISRSKAAKSFMDRKDNPTPLKHGGTDSRSPIPYRQLCHVERNASGACAARVKSKHPESVSTAMQTQGVLSILP